MPGRQLGLNLVITKKGIIEVSTIDIDGWLVRSPETCIFRRWVKAGSKRSEVVATYPDVNEAIKGHDEIVDKVKKGDIK